jgi:hypothetical protein
MSDATVVFGAALAGAVVGSTVSGAATYLGGRTERQNSARAVLYRDLLPELRRAPISARTDAPERTKSVIAHDVVRNATLAGGRAFTLAVAVQDKVEARAQPSTPEEMETAPTIGAGTARRIDRSAESADLEAAIGTFEAWLGRKLGGGLAALRP